MSIVNDSDIIILIVEDDEDISYLLGVICKRKNVACLFSSTLRGAIPLLECNPKICFLDNNLPDGTGLEFIKLIREINKKVIIVMLTAQDINETKKTAINNGADYFIEKPFSIHKIEKLLDKIIAVK